MKTFNQLKISAGKKRAIKNFKKLLFKKIGQDLQSVKLFGSYAREQAGPNSDLDILVLVRRLSEAKKNQVLDSKIEILKKHNLLISPLVMSFSAYQKEKKMPSLFSQFIENEAIEL